MMVSLALVLGVVGQMLSIRTGFPGIVFFLIFGILVGPEFLALVNPNEFGEGLEIIIRLCVAIVLFEAGLNMSREDVRGQGTTIILLITVGALITMVGAAFFAYFLGDLSLEMAFVYGSLVIVTGPTVVQPLLRRFRVKSKLKHILEYEGVLIDPIGALVAIFVVKIVILESNIINDSQNALGITTALEFKSYFIGISKAVLSVIYKFIVGAVLGVIGGFMAAWVVRRFYIYMEDFVDLFILASALSVYGFSELLALDAGLVAAIVSGAIIGNINIPEREEMKKFKGKLTVLVISLLFIFLAASLELKYITDLGINGVFIVLALLFIVRPVQIFLLCMRSGLSVKEKAFLSFVSPRGIIAASIASIIALELQQHEIEGATAVEGLVFLTIAISVLLQGGAGNSVSRLLGVNDNTSKVVILGANNLAMLIGKLFKRAGKEICLMDTNKGLVEIAKSEGLNAIEANALTVHGVEKTDILSPDTFVSLTTSDYTNVLACRLIRTDFRVANVCALLSKNASTAQIQDMERFKIPLVFGKKVDAMDIYSKLSHKEYVVFKFQVRKEEINEMRLEKLFPEHVIPLIVEKPKTGDVLAYYEGVKVEQSDTITVLDIDPLSTSLDVLGKTEKNIIEI